MPTKQRLGSSSFNVRRCIQNKDLTTAPCRFINPYNNGPIASRSLIQSDVNFNAIRDVYNEGALELKTQHTKKHGSLYMLDNGYGLKSASSQQLINLKARSKLVKSVR